jgi:hypothetical protein
MTRTYDDARCTEPWWMDDVALDQHQDRIYDLWDDAADREPQPDSDEETEA